MKNTGLNPRLTFIIALKPLLSEKTGFISFGCDLREVDIQQPVK